MRALPLVFERGDVCIPSAWFGDDCSHACLSLEPF